MVYMRYLALLALLMLPAFSFGQAVPVIPNNTTMCNTTGGAAPAAACANSGTGSPVYSNGATITNATFSPLPGFAPCGPYQVVANNTGSSAAPLCNSSLSLSSVVAGAGGTI